MKKSTGVQYTIRQVPKSVDAGLRALAVREGASLNAVVLDALRAGSGTDATDRRYHDLDALAGTWVNDPAFDRAVEAFGVIDEELWK